MLGLHIELYPLARMKSPTARVHFHSILGELDAFEMALILQRLHLIVMECPCFWMGASPIRIWVHHHPGTNGKGNLIGQFPLERFVVSNMRSTKISERRYKSVAAILCTTLWNRGGKAR